MKSRLLQILMVLSLICVMAGCDNGGKVSIRGAASAVSDSDSVSAEGDSLLDITPIQADSIVFRLTHHYTENFNFVVKDSLMLIPREGDMIKDTCMVYDDDRIVVASIKEIPGDSVDTIWVKVARDQQTMGWVPERELLSHATPDDPISQILDALTGSRAVWMSVLVALGVVGFLSRKAWRKRLQVVKFTDMSSVYPPVLVILVAMLASLYASIQTMVPEFWQEYYFHPTLNPLSLPHVMACLVVLVWLTIIVFVAVVIEVYNHFYFLDGVTYLLELLGIMMVVYLAISWTTIWGIGYILLAAFIIFVIWGYLKYIRRPYICGNCGTSIRRKGVCPECGAVNE